MVDARRHGEESIALKPLTKASAVPTMMITRASASMTTMVGSEIAISHSFMSTNNARAPHSCLIPRRGSQSNGPIRKIILMIAKMPVVSRRIAVINVSDTGKRLSPCINPASFMASRSSRRPNMNWL